MKLVGLMVAKNEGRRVLYSLKAMASIVDEIVYLDDGSTDDTVDLVRSVSEECRITRFIENKRGEHNEGLDRNLLLRAGRSIGGDRFLVLDADEAFSPAAGPAVRKAVENLDPGNCLSAQWTHPWRSAGCYRIDPCPWVGNWRVIAFADDETSNYPDTQLHVQRVPVRSAPCQLSQVLLHFQFMFWPNVEIKQTWYKCLEYIHGQRSITCLNRAYGQAMDETGLKVTAVDADWFHPFFNEQDFASVYKWRLDDIRRWRSEFGTCLDPLLTCPDVNQATLTPVMSEG